MAKRIRSRRERLSVEAIDPRDGKRMVVVVSLDKLLTVARRSIGQTKEAAEVVPMVLQRPTAVFEGLLREADEAKGQSGAGGLCYCGIPPKAYRQDGSPRDAWPGELFLVFVNGDRVVYNWYWYKCDPTDPNLPEGHAERFRERVL